MYNPDYELSDKELLDKYGLKLYSNYEELCLQVTLLYCLKNGYSLKFDDDGTKQVMALCELKKILPEELAKVLEACIARPHLYDPAIVMSVCQASKITNFIDTSEYSQLLVALIQNSKSFILNASCDYRQTLFLPDSFSFNDEPDDTYRYDVLYHFLIKELSASSGINPPENAVDADPSISGFFYDIDGLLYSVDEYMETIGGYLENFAEGTDNLPDE